MWSILRWMGFILLQPCPLQNYKIPRRRSSLVDELSIHNTTNIAWPINLDRVPRNILSQGLPLKTNPIQCLTAIWCRNVSCISQGKQVDSWKYDITRYYCCLSSISQQTFWNSLFHSSILNIQKHCFQENPITIRMPCTVIVDRSVSAKMRQDHVGRLSFSQRCKWNPKKHLLTTNGNFDDITLSNFVFKNIYAAISRPFCSMRTIVNRRCNEWQLAPVVSPCTIETNF